MCAERGSEGKGNVKDACGNCIIFPVYFSRRCSWVSGGQQEGFVCWELITDRERSPVYHYCSAFSHLIFKSYSDLGAGYEPVSQRYVSYKAWEETSAYFLISRAKNKEQPGKISALQFQGPERRPQQPAGPTATRGSGLSGSFQTLTAMFICHQRSSCPARMGYQVGQSIGKACWSWVPCASSIKPE